MTPVIGQETIFQQFIIENRSTKTKNSLLIDAENFEDRIEDVPEMCRQIIASDLMPINKCDLVREAYIEEMKNILSIINPFAKIGTGIFGKFDFGILHKKDDTHFLSNLLKGSSDIPSGHRMKRIAIDEPREFVRSQLYASLSTTIFLYYHQLYGIKGFVRLEGEESPVLVQSTGSKLSFTSY